MAQFPSLARATRILQVGNSKLSSLADLAQHEVERLVRDLARKQHSSEPTQLASKMSSAMRVSGALGDPFAKLKDLIPNTHCDKSWSESQAKDRLKASTVATNVIPQMVGGAESTTCKNDACLTGSELSTIFFCRPRTAINRAPCS